MQPDKYSATWISHSSSGDFLKCPRLYYLRAVYKNPLTGKKIAQMTPPLALGQVVHEVIERLSFLPTEERFVVSPLDKLEEAWGRVARIKGGFKDRAEEEVYYERARQMIQRVIDNPGPVANKAIKIRADGGLPYYWLSEEENIILCGKIDWLEYLAETDSVHIIDFKTGKWEEGEDSLQLPIYYLLATNTQKRKVEKTSYWYLDKHDELTEMKLPEDVRAEEEVMRVAKRMKLARQLGHFKCPEGEEGCRFCAPMEQIAKGKGKLVGESEYGQEIYVLR